MKSPTAPLRSTVRSLTPSATVAINEASNARIAQGEQVFKLGLGQSPFPVPESVVQALRDHAHEKDYLEVAGLAALRESVAGYHRRAGVEAEAENVIVGPGSKELMFILQLVHDGELLIPAPSWVSYAPQAAILGRSVQWIQTEEENGYRLTPEAFDEACSQRRKKAKLLILNYPSNPTGVSYTDAQLAELAKVAVKNEVVVLSDEIYGELTFRGSHASIASHYPQGTIISSGLSKWCGAGGWRLGTFVIPSELEHLRDAMIAVASETFTTTCAPIQYAAIRAFEGGEDLERYLANSRKVLRALVGWAERALRATDVTVPSADGAFYLFPSLGSHRERLAERGVVDDADIARGALEDAGVAFLPGTEFGRAADELCVRLALVDFDGAAALVAADQIPQAELGEAFVKTHCPRVIEGIERLVRWLE